MSLDAKPPLPPSTAGTSTSEYLALQKSYCAMVAHVRAGPQDICDALFEKGLVPSSLCHYVHTLAIPNEDKVRKLIDTLIDKVESDPSVYHGFLSILKNKGPWADSIVEQLEEAFKAEQALVDCDHSSEDSYHSLADHDTPVGGTVKKSEPQNRGKHWCSEFINPRLVGLQ